MLRCEMTDMAPQTALELAEAKVRGVEDRLRAAERMAAIGLLSAGIAHDYNNLLGVILGFGEVALSRPSGPAASDVQQIMSAAHRSAELTRQLLAYSGTEVTHMEVLDPVALITNLSAMLQRTIGPHIELDLHVILPVGYIEVDPSRIERLMMNLVLNARDAIATSGKITIRLAEAYLDDAFVRDHPGAVVGRQVVLSVTDNGSGMDAATLAHVFDTFFTTKSHGCGTGLGLANVCDIVKQSSGNIVVHSTVGRGSTFDVYFPRSQSFPKSTPPPPPSEREALRDRERGVVLVAEDDALLRSLADHALSSAGFRVRVAASGGEALRLCETDAAITLLVTDLVLPGLRGAELAALATKARPGLKVLCTSGYALTDLLAEDTLPDGASFLEKPFLPSLLVTTVRQMFDG